MIAFLALLIGAAIGVVLQPTIPTPLAPYLPVAVIAALDALFGAVRARIENTFSDRIFLVSFLSNVVLAVFLVFLGDQLNVGDALETGVIVVFGVRIFQNLAGVRRHLFHA
jgi:small basic protein